MSFTVHVKLSLFHQGKRPPARMHGGPCVRYHSVATPEGVHLQIEAFNLAIRMLRGCWNPGFGSILLLEFGLIELQVR